MEEQHGFARPSKPKTQLVDEFCPKHPQQQLEAFEIFRGPEIKTLTMCKICTQEEIDKREADGVKKSEQTSVLVHTYEVLMRDSTIPSELKDATFDNYKAQAQEEKDLLEFFKQQTRKYWNDMKGNTLVTGSTGIGKSHLSVAMAKLLNEQYKKIGKPKSFLFVNMTEIIKQIKAGWADKSGQGLTENQVVKRLTEADFLILDDLGAQNSEVKPKSDWEQDLLFDILDKRERTIINTNLTSDELKTAYNARNFSRMLKGSAGNIFKAGKIEDKRMKL